MLWKKFELWSVVDVNYAFLTNSTKQFILEQRRNSFNYFGEALKMVVQDTFQISELFGTNRNFIRTSRTPLFGFNLSTRHLTKFTNRTVDLSKAISSTWKFRRFTKSSRLLLLYLGIRWSWIRANFYGGSLINIQYSNVNANLNIIWTASWSNFGDFIDIIIFGTL